MLPFAILFIASVIGIALTLLTFPGVWLILFVAVVLQLAWGQPLLLSWYTLGIAVGLALIGEIAEFGASALGASRAGGGTWGAIGSIIGASIGALVGTFLILIPVAGTIIGGVVGAAAGAIAGERFVARRSWWDSCRIGHGAAWGRLIATIVKVVIAVAVAILLLIGIIL